jgi:hypothetical protein
MAETLLPEYWFTFVVNCKAQRVGSHFHPYIKRNEIRAQAHHMWFTVKKQQMLYSVCPVMFSFQDARHRKMAEANDQTMGTS